MGPLYKYVHSFLETFRCLQTLSYKDSNLDKQDQNLLCYHYTIGQSIFH